MNDILPQKKSTLAQKIYAAVRQIPRGKVATYSQIAALAGNKNLRRYVGNVLHKNPSNEQTPCHRVVNAKGLCSANFAFGGANAQKEKLESEGVEFTQNQIDMKRFCISEEDFEVIRLALK
ncbi:MGMT family protein [Treponema zioleckii]|uniref:MGMT family protein n=1 Tax=Treponema zioleckii TaxID=331680 RepID=UPI00168B7C76|nr:MGMT family protein [Treponema zioleckii]